MSLDSTNIITGYGGSNNTQWFPDPFMDYSGMHTPKNLQSMLRWCELMWAHNGTYRMALERVIAYFITPVEVLDVTDSTKSRYEEYLNNTLQLSSVLRQIGLDFLFYGNSFSSLFVPFRRYLRCNSCNFEQPIEKCAYTYQRFKFYSSCVKCKYRGAFDYVDRRSMEQDKLRVIRWSPHNMNILFHPLSHNSKFVYRIPSDFKNEVMKGTPFYLQYTPKDFLETIEKQSDLFAFEDDVVFHLKEDTLSGLQNRGWGLPRALSNFKQGFYIQVLKRYNEALAMDYIVPWRVLTPGSRGGQQVDTLLHANLGDFASRIQGMIAEHRRDPLAMHSLPFPVEYQTLGGEANQLAPHELMTVAIDELLNSCGVPAELYKGTLQMQALPSALRLFEATWPHLVSGFNNWTNWLLEGVALAFNWTRARARLTPVTRADDMEARTLRLQLSAANKISDTTALAPFGINVRDEIRRIFDEQRMLEEEAQKVEKEKQQAAEMQRRMSDIAQMRQGGMPGAMGGMPPGAGPGGGLGAPGTGPNGAMAPGDVLTQADQIAQQLVGMPEGERRRQLSHIRQTDETLHAVVKQRLESIRTEARSIGQDQVIAQMTGQAPM